MSGSDPPSKDLQLFQSAKVCVGSARLHVISLLHYIIGTTNPEVKPDDKAWRSKSLTGAHVPNLSVIDIHLTQMVFSAQERMHAF